MEVLQKLIEFVQVLLVPLISDVNVIIQWEYFLSLLRTNDLNRLNTYLKVIKNNPNLKKKNPINLVRMNSMNQLHKIKVQEIKIDLNGTKANQNILKSNEVFKEVNRYEKKNWVHSNQKNFSPAPNLKLDEIKNYPKNNLWKEERIFVLNSNRKPIEKQSSTKNTQLKFIEQSKKFYDLVNQFEKNHEVLKNLIYK